MMVLLAAGVKKSLMFNHLMNAINLAAWVFLMSAGLFYVNIDNWTKNDGFLPNGWGGVSIHPDTFPHTLCVFFPIFCDSLDTPGSVGKIDKPVKVRLIVCPFRIDYEKPVVVRAVPVTRNGRKKFRLRRFSPFKERNRGGKKPFL